MAKPQWKDTTSYSRGERGEIEPRAWSLNVGRLNLIVHRHIGYRPDQWLGTCHDLRLERVLLASISPDLAQREFLDYVRNHVAALLKALDAHR